MSLLVLTKTKLLKKIYISHYIKKVISKETLDNIDLYIQDHY